MTGFSRLRFQQWGALVGAVVLGAASAGCAERQRGVSQCQFQCSVVAECLEFTRAAGDTALEVTFWESSSPPAASDLFLDVDACIEGCEGYSALRQGSYRDCTRAAWGAMHLGVGDSGGALDVEEALGACQAVLEGTCADEGYEGTYVARSCYRASGALVLPLGLVLLGRRRRWRGPVIAAFGVSLGLSAPGPALAADPSRAEVGFGYGFVEPIDVRLHLRSFWPIAGSVLPQHPEWSPGTYLEAITQFYPGSADGGRSGGRLGVDLSALASHLQERLMGDTPTSLSSATPTLDYARLAAGLRWAVGSDNEVRTQVTAGTFSWTRSASARLAGMSPLHVGYWSAPRVVEVQGRQLIAATSFRFCDIDWSSQEPEACGDAGLRYQHLIVPAQATTRTDELRRLGPYFEGHLAIPDFHPIIPFWGPSIGLGAATLRDITFAEEPGELVRAFYLESGYTLGLVWYWHEGDRVSAYLKARHHLGQVRLFGSRPTALQEVRSLLSLGGRF